MGQSAITPGKIKALNEVGVLRAASSMLSTPLYRKINPNTNPTKAYTPNPIKKNFASVTVIQYSVFEQMPA